MDFASARRRTQTHIHTVFVSVCICACVRVCVCVWRNGFPLMTPVLSNDDDGCDFEEVGSNGDVVLGRPQTELPAD